MVVAIVQFTDGAQGVRVAYGTSQKVDELRSGEFSITPADRAAYQLSGLSFPTKFDMDQTQDLPYDEDWFCVPQAPRWAKPPARVSACEPLQAGKSRLRRGSEEKVRVGRRVSP